MKPKWVAVILIWAAFLGWMFAGLRSANRWLDAGPALIGFCLLLLLGMVIAVRCVRRGISEFWRTRGYPRWFMRFAADEKDERRHPARIDPL